MLPWSAFAYRIEVAGAHYDPNTIADLQTYLLPYLDAGWSAP